MIKFSFKTFLRYVLMALAFTLVSICFNSCDVSASALQLENNGTQFYVGGSLSKYYDLLQGDTLPSNFTNGNTFWVGFKFKSTDRNLTKGSFTSIVSICSTGNFLYDTAGLEYIGTNGRCDVNGYEGWAHLYFITWTPTWWTVTKLSDTVVDLQFEGTFNSYVAHGLGYSVPFVFSSIVTYQTGDSELLNIKQQIANGNKLDSLNQTQQQTNDKLDDLNDNITSSDTSSAENKGSSFFENFEDKDYGLSDVITMPLSFIQKISSGTCTPLTMPIPFVKYDLTLPCMSEIYSSYFGDILKIYQTITFGIIAYGICINIFATVRGFKNPDEDRVEVLDL